MERWDGDLEGLQNLIAGLGFEGNWSGISNAHQFRRRDGAILNWYPSTRRVQYQGPANARDSLRDDLGRATQSTPGQSSPVGSPTVATESRSTPSQIQRPASSVVPRGATDRRIFVVHGHDDEAKEQLERILLLLGLNPYVLANTSGGGATLIEALERELGPDADHIRFGIVLLTPDDMGYAIRENPDHDLSKSSPRARQNVVLEMGMLISKIGRPNVAILKKGDVEIPSDAKGIVYLPFKYHVRETALDLCERLQQSGFQLDPQHIISASR